MLTWNGIARRPLISAQHGHRTQQFDELTLHVLVRSQRRRPGGIRGRTGCDSSARNLFHFGVVEPQACFAISAAAITLPRERPAPSRSG